MEVKFSRGTSWPPHDISAENVLSPLQIDVSGLRTT